MINKITLLTIVLLSLVSRLFSQTVHPDYQDGLVVFQLKESERTIPSNDKIVEYQRIDLFTDITSFSIEKIIQMYPEINDSKLRRTYQIELSNPTEVDAVIAIMEQKKEIVYAELKELHHTLLIPNDPIFGTAQNQMWGLHQVNAPQAWDLSTGDANIKVAVTDNAINVNHPDLVNKMLPGWNSAENNNNPNPCGGNNGNHGTHVAGTVGAETDNGIGVASIGWDISIIPVAIGRCSDGALTAGYDGIIWAADAGADVINMSWGGAGSSNFAQNAINYAWNQGAILVAAAGNNNSNQQFYPAAYNNVIAVAATTLNDVRSNFSQYGPWIDIAAPGSSIQSTSTATQSGYQSLQGTSMASPLVSGFLGLMKSFAPNATNNDLINCLYSGADNIDAANPNFVGQLGEGRLNAYQSMLCAQQFAVNNDAAITQILNPKNVVCGNSFEPQIVLRNFGGNTLTSVDITYEWNGNSNSFTWNGSLPTGQTETLTLPVQTSINGVFTFIAFTSNPNNVPDENPSNDQSSNNFTIDTNGETVDFLLETDCFAEEISWEIIDDFGNIVFSGGNYTNNTSGTTVQETFCLAQGCYTFRIYDSYGDGMYGSQWQSCAINGDYSMTDQLGNVIFEMTAPNADFGSIATHEFCIVNASIQNDAGIHKIVTPNPFACQNPLTPVVELRNYGFDNLTSATINYTIGGNVQSFNWSGNLSTGQIDVVALPNINVGTTGPGIFQAYTSNPNGNPDDNPANDMKLVSYTVQANSYSLPFFEDFETNPLLNGKWFIENPDNDITWEVATVNGNSPGNKAMKLDFFNYVQNGERDGLISPKISLQGYNSAEMTFEHAYRRYNQTAADSLIIYISNDCGETYERVFATAEDGTGSFATATTNTNAFTPSIASDWCFNGQVGASCFEINLNDYLGDEIFIKFEAYNGGTIGNNLFIDNINITGVPNNLPPTPAYNASNNVICEGGSITFTDQSSSAITSRSWSFPGGNPATSTSPNPTVTYANPGNYNVSLVVTNANGTESITNTNAVTVNNPPNTPVIVQNNNTLSVILGPGETAQWYFEGSFFGTGASIIISQAGDYYVVVSNGPNCESTSSEDRYEPVLNINDFNLNAAFKLFPNPNNGNFELQADGIYGNIEFVIYDAIGRKLQTYTETFINEKNTIDFNLNGYNNGVYLLVISSENGRTTKRVTINK